MNNESSSSLLPLNKATIKPQIYPIQKPVVDTMIEQQLENKVLDNVGVNFMFNQGADLADGLIDSNRLLTVVNKVKAIAETSKVINYDDVANLQPDAQQKGDWNECLQFMRQNPKLMMQMLPDQLGQRKSKLRNRIENAKQFLK